MSSISTTVNNNLNSYLKSGQKSIIKKALKSSPTESNCFSSFQMLDTKKRYNKLDYSNLKNIKKYNNIQIFSVREKRQPKKKINLNLRMKKNLSLQRKNDNILNSQSSVYLTQNLSEGNFSVLPKILASIENTNEKQTKRKINNERIKDKNRKELKECKSSKEENPPMKKFFFNRLKSHTERKNETEKKINNVNNYLINKKTNYLNIYRKTENSHLNYVEKLHEFLIWKKVYDLRKERLFRSEESIRNKLESVKVKINSIQSNQRLLDNKFMIKYQEYIASLYKEKDKQDNKDIILCTIIYELRRDIKELDKKVKKLLSEKNTYNKWLIFQYQVKNKLLKTPKKYQEYLKMDNTKNLPNELQIYIKNIIFPSPQDLINRIDYYENCNIKSLEIYHKITNGTYPLKDELNKEMIALEKISNVEEIMKLSEINNKLKSKNQILINQINSLKEDKESKKFHTKISQNGIHSKLYEKIKLMRFNILKKNIQEEENVNENLEILKMLKEIEMEIDLQWKKHEFYLMKFNEQLRIEKEKIEKEKRMKKIKNNKKMVEEKQIKLKKNIIDKANKQFMLPYMKINWSVYNIKKIQKKIINENSYQNETGKTNKYGYLYYE